MKTIDLVYFDAGGGHRAAAQALHDLARQQQRPWQMRLVNLVTVLDPQATFRRITGFEPEAYYNVRLRRGWTLGLAQELKLLQAMIRLGHEPAVRTLSRHWQHSRPDMVVSLVPNFNRVMAQALQKAVPDAPYVTVMTDLADHPPHFWIEPGQDQTLVCGSARAVAQGLAAGLPLHRVRGTSGMILRPAFYEPAQKDRDTLRRELGLDPHTPTGIVMFGGHGSVQMLQIAKRLRDVPLIFVCGHNAALLAEIKALERPAAHAAVGFVQDVASLMRAADFFIGKPGPGSLSEAVHLGLPVITFDNASTMPQERYNVQWVRDLGLGLAVRSVRALDAAAAELLESLPEYQARVRSMNNRAVFEVLDILQEVLDESTTRLKEAPELQIS